MKDKQIEKLSETMHAQVIHIYSLINQKTIEEPGAKKIFVAILVIPTTIILLNKISRKEHSIKYKFS